jgi:asparagine synthase (glutamine-hydrolysing)
MPKNPFDNLLYANLTQLSLPQLLHYEDRNSMAHSIEARVPFLDHHLVEYAFALPASQKIKNGLTKAALRTTFQGILPETICMRTDKMGFVTPERVWLANHLYEWIKDILHSPSFQNRSFNSPEISNAFDAHAQGKIDLTQLAWRWVNLELWLRQLMEA